jgi:epoxyqueuosine reductase
VEKTSHAHPLAGTLTRRNLLERALLTAVCLPLGACNDAVAGLAAMQRTGPGQGRRSRSSGPIDPSQIPAYKYSTLPVSRLPALQSEYDRFTKSGGLSRHQAFRDQIAPLSFTLPTDFRDARSVVVLAAFAKTMYATFRLNGRSYRIMVPYQYYADDLNSERLRTIVEKEVIGSPGHRLVDITKRVPLKPLAAHSGLGRYGRNNLIFVDGMGSFNLLSAFLTDYQFREDPWTSLEVLGRCGHCDRCDRVCPTSCIGRSQFTINIDRCITLYNENAGRFPDWILPSMHHALMGCVKCQAPCPVNDGIADVSGDLGEISEEETRRIVQGDVDDALLKSLQQKLRQFPAVDTKETFPVLTRNLRTLVRV